MSQTNASNALDIDPFENPSSRYTGNTSKRGGGAIKAIPDARTAIEKFKQAIREAGITPRACKKLLEEAIQVIESLQKPKDVKIIKAAVTQIQVPVAVHGKSWANVASKSQASETIIRIHDEEEKKEISKLTSEELVKKIGRPEVIAARKMVNRQVKVHFT